MPIARTAARTTAPPAPSSIFFCRVAFCFSGETASPALTGVSEGGAGSALPVEVGSFPWPVVSLAPTIPTGCHVLHRRVHWQHASRGLHLTQLKSVNEYHLHYPCNHHLEHRVLPLIHLPDQLPTKKYLRPLCYAPWPFTSPVRHSCWRYHGSYRWLRDDRHKGIEGWGKFWRGNRVPSCCRSVGPNIQYG